MTTSEQLVREAFEPVIQAQIQKLNAMRTKCAQMHKLPEEKVQFQLRAEGRVNITTTFTK